MKLKGKEKQFWWHFKNINDTKDIPKEISCVRVVDTVDDDEYLFLLTSRVSIVHEIYLDSTRITDKGVSYISGLQKLNALTIRKHPKITKDCLPYLNKLVDLKYLDISKTKISLEDLAVLTNLKKLKELYVSSENTNEEYIFVKIVSLKEILPNCIVYVNYESYE